MNFNFNEIVKLKDINRIFEKEIDFLKNNVPNLFVPDADISVFLKKREDYLFRFYKYKYLIYIVVDDYFSLDFEEKVNEWKFKICNKNSDQKTYYHDLNSLNNFILCCLPGKYQAKDKRILWSYLEEFGYENGYEKIRQILPEINNVELQTQLQISIEEYDILMPHKKSLLKIVNSKNYIMLFDEWLSKSNNDNILNSVITFLNFQKFHDENKNIDLLIEKVADKIEDSRF